MAMTFEEAEALLTPAQQDALARWGLGGFCHGGGRT